MLNWVMLVISVCLFFGSIGFMTYDNVRRARKYRRDLEARLEEILGRKLW